MIKVLKKLFVCSVLCLPFVPLFNEVYEIQEERLKEQQRIESMVISVEPEPEF